MTPPRNRKSEDGNPPPTADAPELYPNQTATVRVTHGSRRATTKDENGPRHLCFVFNAIGSYFHRSNAELWWRLVLDIFVKPGRKLVGVNPVEQFCDFQ